MSGIIIPAPGSKAVAVADSVVPRSNRQRRWALGRRAKIELLIASGAACLLIAAQIGFHLVFAQRILPGTVSDGVNIGWMTPVEAKQHLAMRVAAQRYTFSIGATSYSLKPADIGVQYDLDATVKGAAAAGHGSPVSITALWPGHSQNVGLIYYVDKAAESTYITKLVTENGVAPVNAAIAIHDGDATVTPDHHGQGVTAVQVRALLDGAIDGESASAHLQPAVIRAAITTDTATAALPHIKSLIATPVTITYRGKSYTPEPAEVGKWLAFDGLTPKINPDAVRAYLASIASQIDVPAQNRKINVANGVATEVQAGVNGAALDQDAVLAKLSSAVLSTQAVALEAPMRPIPYQTQYNETLSYPKYIEVNLSKQHLWVYQDGRAIYDSPVTSGATGAGFPTVTGTFNIYAKQTNRRLIGYQYGYNYNVFVQYWMPFYEGYGLHDASWRHGSFGGSDYYYGGSHGCVNLPLATAAYIYSWADVGTPVWVHN